MDFREAERRYLDLRRRYDAGDLSVTEFDRAREQLKVQDARGRWWVKGRQGDQWYYHDGSAWTPGTPASSGSTPVSGSISGGASSGTGRSTTSSGAGSSGAGGWDAKAVGWAVFAVVCFLFAASQCSAV